MVQPAERFSGVAGAPGGAAQGRARPAPLSVFRSSKHIYAQVIDDQADARSPPLDPGCGLRAQLGTGADQRRRSRSAS